MKFDHFYIKVDDLDKAIEFYENLLETKISNREGDRWADFEKDSVVYFGIYNAAYDNKIPVYGNNAILSLRSKNIENDHVKIKAFKPVNQSEIIIIKQPSLYKYFQFSDPWGNVWEVAEYDY